MVIDASASCSPGDRVLVMVVSPLSLHPCHGQADFFKVLFVLLYLYSSDTDRGSFSPQQNLGEASFKPWWVRRGPDRDVGDVGASWWRRMMALKTLKRFWSCSAGLGGKKRHFRVIHCPDFIPKPSSSLICEVPTPDEKPPTLSPPALHVSHPSWMLPQFPCSWMLLPI